MLTLGLTTEIASEEVDSEVFFPKNDLGLSMDAMPIVFIPVGASSSGYAYVFFSLFGALQLHRGLNELLC